jgi:uncharacterized protein (DUF1697 family)
MPVFVALLRGVNVGKAKRLPMAEFRAILAGLGYTDAATVLNSGNAVFRASGRSADKLATDIAGAIGAKLHLDVPVVVKSAAELSAIVAENPLAKPAPDPSRLLVAFTQQNAALRDLSPIAELAAARERFVIGKHAAYFHCPAGIMQSRAGEALLGKAGRAATTRNWATTLKLQALAAASGRGPGGP